MFLPLFLRIGAVFVLSGAALPAAASPMGVTVPPAPTITSVVPGNYRVTVSYSLNGDGGDPIVGKIINCGSVTVFGGNNPLPVTGLPNGVAVTCRIRARNGLGDGPWSADSDPVTPVGPPEPVTDVVATRGNGQVSVAFVPGGDGGLPATFDAQCGTQTVSGVASPLLVTGLANGVSVTCEAWSTNSAGAGPRTAANAVTPATLPAAPTVTGVESGDASARVSFDAPADDGGAPVTGYAASCTPGTHVVQGVASPLTVAGLANGETYTCSVAAINDVGAGASSAGTAVVPRFAADLAVTIDNGQSFIPGGSRTVYLIDVHNGSARAVSGVRVSSVPDAAFSAVSWICSAQAGSQCPDSGSGSIDVMVDLAPNAGVSFLLGATVAALPEAPVGTSVTIIAPNSVADPVAANDGATDGPDEVGVFADGFE
jgi:hypothetical protein